MNKLAKELKKVMIEENITQKALAERLGMIPQTLNTLFNKKHFNLEDAERVADALGYDIKVEFIKRK